MYIVLCIALPWHFIIKELGSNPERISKKLMQYANKINWH